MDGISALKLGIEDKVNQVAVIANNAANVATPGFKREILSFIGTDAGVPVSNVAVDMRQGEIRNTGRKLDVALSGQGFFEIVSSGGEVAYTRKGAFRLDDQNRLVTLGGAVVMGESGGLILSGSDTRIDPEGYVWEGSTKLGQLKLVSFPEGTRFFSSSSGEGVLPLSELALPDSSSASVLQGSLEASNVDGPTEMIHLVEAFRAYESMAKVVQVYDGIQERLLRDLGQF